MTKLAQLLQIFAILLLETAKAQTPPTFTTSLYIPGYEGPAPVDGDVLGVGQDGRTTWVIRESSTLPGNPGSSSLLIGTATLVAGPHDASFTFANSPAGITIGGSCTLSGSSSNPLAICEIVPAGGSTVTQTELVSRVPVRVTGSVTASSALSISGSSLAPTSSMSGLPTISTVPSQSGIPAATQTSGGPACPHGVPLNFAVFLTLLAVCSLTL